MKVGSNELFQVVRAVVREEVKKILPEVVRQHLTETYIRQMVKESVNSKKGPGISELLSLNPSVDEDNIPEPLPNTDMGIYNANTLTKPELRRQVKDESVDKLKRNLGPLSFVLEGVQIPGDEGSTPDVPLNKVKLDPDRMNHLIEALDRSSESRKSMPTSNEAKMRELEMRRKALEIPTK